MAWSPPRAPAPRGVARVNPSAAVQTASPEMSAGIGKVEEGPGREGRVQEIFPRSPEDFLPYDHPKDNPQGRLPQGQGGRQGQGIEKARDEEALVDLVPSHDGKNGLAKAPGHLGHEVEGEKVEKAVGEV